MQLTYFDDLEQARSNSKLIGLMYFEFELKRIDTLHLMEEIEMSNSRMEHTMLSIRNISNIIRNH